MRVHPFLWLCGLACVVAGVITGRPALGFLGNIMLLGWLVLLQRDRSSRPRVRVRPLDDAESRFFARQLEQISPGPLGVDNWKNLRGTTLIPVARDDLRSPWNPDGDA